MPRRLSDEEHERKLAHLAKRARQLMAQREQLVARRANDERQRLTRAKRVLGEAILHWLDAKAPSAQTPGRLVERFVAQGRDREVVAWAVQRTHAEPPPSANLLNATPAGRALRRRRPDALDAADMAAWRRREERARIVLGGAVLRRLRRTGETPFSLVELVEEDLVRAQDVAAVGAVVDGVA